MWLACGIDGKLFDLISLGIDLVKFNPQKH